MATLDNPTITQQEISGEGWVFPVSQVTELEPRRGSRLRIRVGNRRHTLRFNTDEEAQVAWEYLSIAIVQTK